MGAATLNDKLYAYPMTADNGYFLYYDASVLTAEDVQSMDTMLEKAAVAGKKFMMSVNDAWYNYSFYAGAGLVATLADDGVNTVCNWNEAPGADVTQAILDITANPGFKSGADADIASAIKDGSCCAAISGTWNASTAEGAWGEGYAATKLPTYTLLTLPVLGVVVFTIVPLFILIAVAFTNYDQQHMPPAALFTWVGLANFAALFGGQSLTVTFSYAFGRVLGWTLVWAFFATFTTFFGGVFLAMLINNKKTKCQKLWRTLFMVTIAVPQFVTLLLVRNFFSDAGIFNTLMTNAGVTDFLKTIGLLGQNMNHIPFLTDQHWAKFMIVLINVWVGVPYQMIIATGVLMNIPSDMLEASTIDGASPWQSFIHIKLPYLFSVQGPALVTDFVKNVNNFNVIYLLTQDVYITKDQALASSSAKEVDLLVT